MNRTSSDSSSSALDVEIERVRAFHGEQHRTFNWLDCRQQPCLGLQARLVSRPWVRPEGADPEEEPPKNR